MNVGDNATTPRFLTVTIKAIFDSDATARESGFTEPTHYIGDWEIKGKAIGENRMKFGAYPKPSHT